MGRLLQLDQSGVGGTAGATPGAWLLCEAASADERPGCSLLVAGRGCSAQTELAGGGTAFMGGSSADVAGAGTAEEGSG